MSLSRRGLLALPMLAALPARAETWPTKAVHIVVPLALGSPGDITARLIGLYIEKKTGRPFVIENKPGANGVHGAVSVKAAPPDGYTLMLATTSTNAVNPYVYKKPGYDPEKDFDLVGMIGESGAFLVVPADSPHKTLSDLLGYAKSNPGKLSFGYFNASSQVPAEVLGKRAGLEWQSTSYKAIGTAWSDLFADTIDFMFVDLTASRGQVVAGKARPLAVTLPARSKLYPDVPALAETLPGFVATSFLALAVAKAVPLDIKQTLNDLINEAVFSGPIHKRLVEEFALDPRKLDLAQCAEEDRSERARWADYVKIAKIEPE